MVGIRLLNMGVFTATVAVNASVEEPLLAVGARLL
jgi:hypothetical protein